MLKNPLILLLIPVLSFAQTTADQVLAKTMSYHDAHNNWSSLSAMFIFQETRPDGADRSTTLIFNNAISYVKINRNDEEVYEISGDEAQVLVGDGNAERALTLRNYYIYLWGLPMKLLDQTTPEITLAKDETVGKVTCKVLRVAYEKDTWYFYIDNDSGRMLQYKFHQEGGKRELITLEGEIIVDGIKIPKKRNWYLLPEMKYLGTDVLLKIK